MVWEVLHELRFRRMTERGVCLGRGEMRDWLPVVE